MAPNMALLLLLLLLSALLGTLTAGAGAAGAHGAGGEPLLRDEQLVQAFKAKPLRAVMANATIPYSYPLFSQCDSKWGADIMVTKTVCQVGCLVSSTSMALRGSNIPIPPPPSSGSVSADPGTFNSWLKANGGYDDSNDFIESSAEQINGVVWPADAMHKTNDLSFDTVRSYIQKGRIMIANVNQGHHFVLAVGWGDDADTIMVNDPGYDRDSYSYSKDIVGWRIFDMVRQ